MKQLLRLTSIPLKIQFSVERARLEVSQEKPPTPQVEVTRTGGKMQMQSKPTQIRMDSFEYRKSVGLKSASATTEDAYQRGKQAAMEATAAYAEFGNQIVHIEKGANIPDTAFSQYFQRATAGDLVLLPISPVDISWESGSLDMNYTPVTMNFDWETGNGRAKMEYIPGKFSIDILQYPSLNIEYLGEPIFVPPSSNPNYEAIA